MDEKTLRQSLDLPEDAPIPGAMYRRKQPNNHWEFATVIALEVLSNDRWVAVYSSVRFGEERITSDHNSIRSFELHSVPQAFGCSLNSSMAGKDALDLLLSAEA